MIFKIINPINLGICRTYNADVPWILDEAWGSCISILVPEGLDPDCVKAQLNENNEIELVEDPVLTAAKILANKTERIAVLNQTTWSTVLAEACTVYGLDPSNKTSMEISILAMTSHSTYQDMVDHPASYVGEIFADQAAVLAYAEPLLLASSAFGKWRLGILAAEAVQKAAILAE